MEEAQSRPRPPRMQRSSPRMSHQTTKDELSSYFLCADPFSGGVKLAPHSAPSTSTLFFPNGAVIAVAEKASLRRRSHIRRPSSASASARSESGLSSESAPQSTRAGSGEDGSAGHQRSISEPMSFKPGELSSVPSISVSPANDSQRAPRPRPQLEPIITMDLSLYSSFGPKHPGLSRVTAMRPKSSDYQTKAILRPEPTMASATLPQSSHPMIISSDSRMPAVQSPPPPQAPPPSRASNVPSTSNQVPASAPVPAPVTLPASVIPAATAAPRRPRPLPALPTPNSRPPVTRAPTPKYHDSKNNLSRAPSTFSAVTVWSQASGPPTGIPPSRRTSIFAGFGESSGSVGVSRQSSTSSRSTVRSTRSRKSTTSRKRKGISTKGVNIPKRRKSALPENFTKDIDWAQVDAILAKTVSSQDHQNNLSQSPQATIMGTLTSPPPVPRRDPRRPRYNGAWGRAARPASPSRSEGPTVGDLLLARWNRVLGSAPSPVHVPVSVQ